jgi:hypothetical protein
LSGTEIWKKITELELSTAKLRDDIAKLTIREAPVAQPKPVEAVLARDLAQRTSLLEIRTTLDSVTLKPKGYLGPQDFRAVSEVVRKYGGFWSSQTRMFIIRKRG